MKIDNLLKKIKQAELKTEAGKINFFSGIGIFILILSTKIWSSIERALWRWLFHKESDFGSYHALIVATIIYFFLSVLVVSLSEKQKDQ